MNDITWLAYTKERDPVRKKQLLLDYLETQDCGNDPAQDQDDGAPTITLDDPVKENLPVEEKTAPVEEKTADADKPKPPEKPVEEKVEAKPVKAKPVEAETDESDEPKQPNDLVTHFARALAQHAPETIRSIDKFCRQVLDGLYPNSKSKKISMVKQKVLLMLHYCAYFIYMGTPMLTVKPRGKCEDLRDFTFKPEWTGDVELRADKLASWLRKALIDLNITHPSGFTSTEIIEILDWHFRRTPLSRDTKDWLDFVVTEEGNWEQLIKDICYAIFWKRITRPSEISRRIGHFIHSVTAGIWVISICKNAQNRPVLAVSETGRGIVWRLMPGGAQMAGMTDEAYKAAVETLVRQAAAYNFLPFMTAKGKKLTANMRDEWIAEQVKPVIQAEREVKERAKGMANHTAYVRSVTQQRP